MARKRTGKTLKTRTPPEGDLFGALDPPLDSSAGVRSKAPAHSLPSPLVPFGMELAEVAVESVVRGTFTYLVDATLQGRLVPGARVLVPFGARTVPGYYVGPRSPEDFARAGFDPARLKKIVKRLDVEAPEAKKFFPGQAASPAGFQAAQAPADRANGGADTEPLLTPELLDLARWIARHYACSLGAVLAAMLPAGVKRGASAARTRWVSATEPPEKLRAAAEASAQKAPKQSALLRALLEAASAVPAAQLLAQAKAPPSALGALERQGLVRISEKTAPSLGEAYADAPTDLSPGPSPGKGGEKFGGENVGEDFDGEGVAVKSGGAGGMEHVSSVSVPLRLTEAQRAALETLEAALHAGRPRAFLLQGVTGSGKTEVYLRALAATLAQGRQGLVLVPEIALTPQTAQRFEERLGRARVAVLHSHRTEGERAEAWRAARAGKIGAIVGARSALFAPLPKLGCIVVDEEHEGAFKQETAPRYQACAVAEERARACGAVLILGSATPSLESLHAARTGRLERLLLPDRVTGHDLPPVSVVDMREENRDTKRFNYLSRPLGRALAETLARREQAILFLNRRGFATVVTCLRCGHTERCAQCDITLTSHRDRGGLACHYCGFEKPIPDACVECGAPGVKFWGLGTERIETEVRKTFPQARVARMDSDTMARRDAYIETLSAFRAGKLDVLVGTQMIAKGLDFPNVTLVGIVLADTALHRPDFRSRERTFQLLEQVAGRAGRGPKGGRVIVQTHLPGDPAIRAAAQHDYEGFAQDELRERAAFFYPPYARLARVLVRSKDAAHVEAAARAAGEALRAEACGARTEILGPAPAPIAKIEGLHRWHLLVKAADGETLAEMFNGPAGVALRKLKGAEAQVDIDPLDML